MTPDHLEPYPEETLPRYALRVAERQGIGPDDVVGGVSFGGMIAGEIARQRPVAGLILLGSCLRPMRLPWTYRWIERACRLVPDFVFCVRSWRPLVRWRFAPLTQEAETCLVEMMADYPMSLIRAFGRMAVDWEGVTAVACPVFSVHGDMDRIIPLKLAKPDVILKDAGHAFTLTHSGQTVTAIRDFLKHSNRAPAA